MKARMTRRGAWSGGHWAARARWREDSRLLIVERVEVWTTDGRLLGTAHERAAVADARALDRLACHHAERMQRHAPSNLHDIAGACLQAA